jgi:hypothetical protein
MPRQATFVARLFREGREPESVRVPRASPAPPTVLRRPAGGNDQLIFDVYALIDADGWPADAAFTFVETVSRLPADPDV